MTDYTPGHVIRIKETFETLALKYSRIKRERDDLLDMLCDLAGAVDTGDFLDAMSRKARELIAKVGK